MAFSAISIAVCAALSYGLGPFGSRSAVCRATLVSPWKTRMLVGLYGSVPHLFSMCVESSIMRVRWVSSCDCVLMPVGAYMVTLYIFMVFVMCVIVPMYRPFGCRMVLSGRVFCNRSCLSMMAVHGVRTRPI